MQPTFNQSLVQTGREDNTSLMKILGILAGISLIGFGAVYVLFRRNRDDEFDQNDEFLFNYRLLLEHFLLEVLQ